MSEKTGERLLAIAAVIERIVVIGLMLLMLIVVLIATFELGALLFQELLDPMSGGLMLDINELMTLFGFFFLILIGIELLETIRVYLEEDTVHAEVVLLAALIAAARKVIVLDLKVLEPGAIIGLAAIIFALAGGYFLIKRSRHVPS